MIVNPQERAADYAAPLDPRKVAALGYRAVVRYINGSPNHWKVLTPRERDAIHAAGLGLMCVWETTASRPLSGAAGGRQDGWRAAVDLDRLGCPRNIAVLAAVDIDVTAANLRQVVAYLEGFRDAVGRPAGVYGDFDVIEAVRAWSACNWQANARWWSRHPQASKATPLRVHPAAHMRQYLPEDTPAGQLDPNVCLRPVRFWSTTDPDPETEDTMRLVLIEIDGPPTAVFLAKEDRGLIYEMEWSGPGSDPDVQARLGLARGAGVPTRRLGVNDLRLSTLVGPVPTGDPGHNWTGDEFFRVVA